MSIKQYDFKKARQIIDEYVAKPRKKSERLESASLGIESHFDETSETVWFKGGYVSPLDKDTYIQGLNGSQLGTPSIELTRNDGWSKRFECYVEVKPKKCKHRWVTDTEHGSIEACAKCGEPKP